MRDRLKLPSRIHRGFLAEDYDGIGQYVMVTLSRLSTSAARLARVAAGDFGGGRTFPAGTPVTVFSVHGRLEVLLGNNELCTTDHFRRTSEVTTKNWGLGQLGQWLSLSDMATTSSENPALDEPAWTDGEYGIVEYSGLNNPTQGLRIAQPQDPENDDPEGLPATRAWPLDIEYLVKWGPGATTGYLQIYLGPAFHYVLNAWMGITTQWYGPGDPEELYGMEIDAGYQGWAQWPVAVDSMFGNVWFHGAIAQTLEEVVDGLRVKILADNSGIFAKAWVQGTSEPSDWFLKVYWDPNDPMYSRIRDFFRIIVFEVQTSDMVMLDWIKLCPGPALIT